MEDNLGNELTLTHLTRKNYTPRYYFHRMFSAVMGCTLMEYINQRRLNKAIFYLRNSDDSIARIVYSLEFGSQSAFT
jgi:AraC family transcriptional regulator